MKTGKILSLILAMVLVLGCLPGCNGGGEEIVSQLPFAINEADVEVIDDLPDWTGEKLDLTVWYTQGTNDMSIGKYKKDDKFQGELARVSGISFNEKESFDNGGTSVDGKIARIVAGNLWPHVAVGLGDGPLAQDLANEGLTYELSGYVEKFMPNFMKYINSHEVLKTAWEKRKGEDGKVYSFSHLGREAYRYADPDYTEEKYSSVVSAPISRGYFFIRDDILKAVRPEAHTVKEYQDMFMADGTIAPEKLIDYTVDSLDEFRKLIEDIDALGVTEDGKKVWPIYTYDGMDNWSLLNMFLFPAGTGYNSPSSYFLYYDNEAKELKNPAKEQWFKDYVKFFNQLYRDGLASEEALIDTKAAFDQKKNNGEYAILYGLNTPPTDAVLEAGGKPYKYRKVFIDIPLDAKKFANAKSVSVWDEGSLTFFKDKLTEAQLEQILRMIDFCYTDAGMIYAQWGPEKSGLYEVTEDGLRFVDEKFKQAVIYAGDDQVLYDYGYESFPPIKTFIGGGRNRMNFYNSVVEYADIKKVERIPGNYISEISINRAIPYEDVPMLTKKWDIWTFTSDIEGAKQMWNGRQSIEDAFTLALAAKTDEAFEEAWAKILTVEERNGYTDETLAEMNAYFEEINAADIEAFKKWKY